MHRTTRSIPLFLSVSTLALGLSASAINAQDFELGTIVVTPNRTPTELSKVGSTVEVVEKKEIEEQSLPLVIDYLTLLPGINLSPQGGMGKNTTMIMRGARGQYVKTLYNGIDISDVSAPTPQASFAHLMAGEVDRIEVLKGSQGMLYGSDAIAGVVNISTLGGVQMGVTHSVFGEAGSNKTFRGGYALDAGFERGQFGFSLSGVKTDGFSAAAAGTEDDGYRNVTGTINGRFDASEDLSFFANGLFINGRTEYDDAYPAPLYQLGDSDAYSTYHHYAGRVGADFKLFDGRLNNTVSAQISDISRKEYSSYPGTYDGRRVKLDYLGSLEVSPMLTVNFGADWERNHAETSAGIDKSVSMGGGWVEAVATPVDPLTVTLGLRHDEHSTYGGYTTWRATGSYRFEATGTRLHSSVGTGFRAPSLYELYAPLYGNADLEPETSVSFDVGVEQSFLDGRLTADLTYFMLNIDDFIGYDPVTYQNIQTEGTIRTRGVEASMAYAVTDWFDLAGSYTYTKATRPDGTREVRIPRHDIALSAVVRPAEKWEIAATGKIALDTVDGGELDDYFLLNAKVAYKPTENTELYLRAENILDQDYQVVRGYNTQGFSVFAGFKAKFAP